MGRGIGLGLLVLALALPAQAQPAAGQAQPAAVQDSCKDISSDSPSDQKDRCMAQLQATVTKLYAMTTVLRKRVDEMEDQQDICRAAALAAQLPAASQQPAKK